MDEKNAINKRIFYKS